MKKIMIPLILATLSPSIYAAVYKTVQMDQTYTNTNCELTDSCDLVSFRVRVEDARVVSNSFGTNFTTGSFTEYQTSSVDKLQKYAVVQFIKGCQYNSKPGGIEYGGISREFYNEIVPFKHPHWVIDSVDSDPVYNSSPDFGDNRHAYYRWNEVEGSFKKETEHYYIQQTPHIPRLYVLDRPGTAFTSDDGNEAKNISLQFKTCIYKTADIPVESSPEQIGFGTAIKCMKWKSSYVYDHTLKKYTSPNHLSDYCLRP